MSGSMAKATRRQIRKAFGSRAVDEVEAIAGDVRQDVISVQQSHADHEERLTALASEIERLRNEAADFRGQGWKARLRWIALGV